VSIIQQLVIKIIGNGPSKTVFKNMGILASGSIVSKLIGLCAYPLITRIYSPNDFGVVAVFVAATFILFPFCSLRYSVTIPLPKKDETAVNILVLGLILTFVSAVLFSMIFFAAGNEIFSLFNSAVLAGYWWLLILGIIGASIFELLTNWATRINSFGIVARSHIWQTIAMVVAQVGLGLLGFKPAGLLVGEVFRKWCGSIVQYHYFFNGIKQKLKNVTIRRVVFVFKYYADLPLFHLPSQLISVLTLKIPLLFFAFKYGADTAGQLGLALMVVGIPVGLIGKTTSNAYYAEIAKIGNKRKKEVLELTVSLTKRLVALSIAPTIILLLFSPFLFQLIFGPEWLQAGQFTSILAFYLFFEFLATPFIQVFNVFNLQRIYLQISGVRLALIGTVFISVHIWNIDVYTALIAYTVFMIMHFVYVILKIYAVIK
jgi:O-antigen/teichoic acid export membrane protein